MLERMISEAVLSSNKSVHEVYPHNVRIEHLQMLGVLPEAACKLFSKESQVLLQQQVPAFNTQTYMPRGTHPSKQQPKVQMSSGDATH